MPGDTNSARDTEPGQENDAEPFGERRRKRRYLEEGGPALMEPTAWSGRPMKRVNDLGGADGPDSAPGYYDLPMLKPPVWKWEISAYFFLGGLSAGAFLLSRMATHFGGQDDEAENLKRTGAAVAALAALPCAPLLIADLGDRARFHHMLRVWKPASPMNLGSWVLTGYSALAFLDGLRLWSDSDDDGRKPPARPLRFVRDLLRWLGPLAEGASDIAGIPLALLLAGYTGVLLSGSATPVWSKNLYLGALFSASALGTGASACRVALLATAPTRKALPASTAGGGAVIAETPAEARARMGKTLGHIEMAAHIGETLALIGYLTEAGSLAEPLTKGKQSRLMRIGAEGLGMVVPTVLEAIPAPPKVKRWLRVAASAASLLGGLALRHAMVHAGHDSASEARYNRDATRSRTEVAPQKDNAPPPMTEAAE